MQDVLKDIAVTGIAAISAAGVGIEPLRDAVWNRKSLLQPVPEDIVGETGHFWGKAADFKSSDFMPPIKARKFDRCSLFAVVAAGMALRDAGVRLGKVDPARVGIALGCGFGGISNSEEFLRSFFMKGGEGLAPMLFPNTVPNAPASNASIEHGLHGPNTTMVQRFCSAESAFLTACRFLQEGRADIMLTGGVDDLNPLMLTAFKAMGQLRRFGSGFGEGAGILVLEKRENAVRREARILAQVSGIRTIGTLLPGREDEGLSRLGGPPAERNMVSLSGSASEALLLGTGVSAPIRLETGKLLGRSLAMGGLSMVSLVLSLQPSHTALHLSASPEGPYYAIDFEGGGH